MKQRLRLPARSSLTLLAMLLVIGIGYSIVQLQPASADSSVDPAIEDSLCSSTFPSLSVSNDLYGCGYPGYTEPRYSGLQVNLAAAAIAILTVYVAWFASRKYFAKSDKKSSRRLAYATILGIILLAAAVIFTHSSVPVAWTNNNWVSNSSAEVLAAVAFVPPFAVLAVCLVKAQQHKQRTFWIANAVLAAAAVYLAILSTADVAGLWSQGL